MLCITKEYKMKLLIAALTLYSNLQRSKSVIQSSNFYDKLSALGIHIKFL